MGRLEGKSVIITGAGSGIGRAASLLFTKEGAKLIAVDRSDGVKETAKLVSDAGGTVEAVMADAGSESDVKAFIDQAVSKYGRLDAIWANAGVSGGLVPLAEQTVEHWQEILRINLIGPFLAIKHAMPHMIQQKSGAIVCTASVAGLKSGASGHPYAASKAGVISLVQTTAYSLSGTGVRINAVCPGLIETGMTKPIFDGAKERGTEGKIGQLNPLEARRPAARDRRDGTVPGQRRCVLRQRPGDPGRRRPHRVDAVCGQAGLSSLRPSKLPAKPCVRPHQQRARPARLRTRCVRGPSHKPAGSISRSPAPTSVQSTAPRRRAGRSPR